MQLPTLTAMHLEISEAVIINAVDFVLKELCSPRIYTVISTLPTLLDVGAAQTSVLGTVPHTLAHSTHTGTLHGRRMEVHRRLPAWGEERFPCAGKRM